MSCFLRTRALFLIAASATLSLAAAAASEGTIFDATLGADDACEQAGLDGGVNEGSCSLSALQKRTTTKTNSRLATTQAAAYFESAPKHEGFWTRQERCTGDKPHDLIFAIVSPEGLERTAQMARDRTDPRSANFRHWLSREEVAALTRNDVGLSTVKALLRKHNSTSVLTESLHGDLLRVRAPVATWEQLLSTEFHVYRHNVSGRLRVRATAYSLPEEIQGHIAGVLGVLELDYPEHSGKAPPSWVAVQEDHVMPSWRDSRTKRSNLSGCFPAGMPQECDTFKELEGIKRVLVTPDVLRKAYNMPLRPAAPFSPEAEAQSQTSQVVFASLNQHWSPDDRSKFQAQFGIPQKNVTLLTGNGWGDSEYCNLHPGHCDESNLDVQYMTAMSPWSSTGYFYSPSNQTFYDFLFDFAELFYKSDHPPHVISISYGMSEVAATHSAVTVFNYLAQKLALEGVTVLVASGDDGAAGPLDRNTTFGDCCANDVLGLQVSWPASSPWVTGVGATMGIGSGSPEVACQVNATACKAFLTQETCPRSHCKWEDWACHEVNGVFVNGDVVGSAGATFGPQDYSIKEKEAIWVDGLGCTHLSEDLTGKVAIISRGACTFVDKVMYAQEKGAVGVLIANNVYGAVFGMDGYSGVATIPSRMVSKSSAEQIQSGDVVSMQAEEDFEEEPALITSGGGFSMISERPEYQNGHHDSTGRGVPDIALAGHAFAIVVGGKWGTVDGTSASSPAFAGLVSLINTERILKGLPRVGFLNPMLYAEASSAFNDITIGDNRCGSSGTPCCGGFDAAIGWDPVTGLGTPNFAKLMEFLSN